jgi:hypothetical protein
MEHAATTDFSPTKATTQKCILLGFLRNRILPGDAEAQLPMTSQLSKLKTLAFWDDWPTYEPLTHKSDS